MSDKPVSLSASKSIEIYATLPKKKTLRNKLSSINVIEDEEYMLYDRPTHRTGLFGRSRRYEENKKDKKRARSEEHNKNISKEFALTSAKLSAKTSKFEKSIENVVILNSKNQALDIASTSDQKQNKKQHKIRRKLLMGGLIKRKNRSMPDLREGQNRQDSTSSEVNSNTMITQFVDDLSIDLKENDVSASLSGYLSEGHLEFSSSGSKKSGNPNLERSRLMRKSFHGSMGKVLPVAKVPPPPPLRTTSQLSKTKSMSKVHYNDQSIKNSVYSLTNEQNTLNLSHAKVSCFKN